MTHRARFFSKVAIIIIVLLVCLNAAIIAVIRHSIVLAIASVTVAFFASFSRFTKEAQKERKWIRQWHLHTKRSLHDYFCVLENPSGAAEELHPELNARGIAFVEGRQRLAGLRAGSADIREIKQCEVDVEVQKYHFLRYWNLLRHMGALPVDPATGEPYEKHQYSDYLDALALEVVYA